MYSRRIRVERQDRRLDDGAVERLPVVDQAQIEAIAQLLPEAVLGVGGPQGRLEQAARR